VGVRPVDFLLCEQGHAHRATAAHRDGTPLQLDAQFPFNLHFKRFLLHTLHLSGPSVVLAAVVVVVVKLKLIFLFVFARSSSSSFFFPTFFLFSYSFFSFFLPCVNMYVFVIYVN